MDSLSSSDTKIFQSNFTASEKGATTSGSTATKPRGPNPDTSTRDIEASYPCSDTQLSQRKTSPTTLNKIPVSTKNQSKESGQNPLRCLSKADERNLFLAFAKADRHTKLQEKLLEKDKRQYVQIRLIDTARALSRKKNFKESLSILEKVLISIKDTHDPLILCALY